MTIDRLLGILGLLLGLPGFLLLFFDQQRSLGILCLIIGFLLIIIAITYGYYNRPKIIYRNVIKRLTFEANNEENANLEQTIEAQINFQINQLEIDKISSDGSISQILIDGQQPDISRTLGGQTLVAKTYNPPQPANTRITLNVQYRYFQAFPGNREGVVHVVTKPTNHLQYIISFPNTKNVTDSQATLRSPGVVRRLPNPTLSNNNKRLEFNALNLQVGEEYWIEWNWI